MKGLITIGVALLLLAPAIAVAAPSLTAPDTGLVDIPTASIAANRSFSLAASWQQVKGVTPFEGVALEGNAIPIRLVAGIGDRAELGIAWTRLSLDDEGIVLEDGLPIPTTLHVDSSNLLGFAAKYLVTPETETMPAVAVGVRYGKLNGLDGAFAVAVAPTTTAAGQVTVDVTSTTVYAVASKQLSKAAEDVSVPLVTGHLGIAWQRLKFEEKGAFATIEGGDVVASDSFADSSSESKLGAFLGVDMSSAAGTNLGLEFRTKRSAFEPKAIFSALVRHPITPALTAEAGWTNAMPGLSVGLDKHGLFVGLSYNFLAATGY